MTIILGVAHEDKVYMGGDSLAVKSWGSKSLVTSRKVVRIGDLLIGCAGDLRVLNLLQHAFELPSRTEDRSDDTYIIVDVMAAFRALMNDHEVKFEDTDVLIGYRGCLFCVDGSYAAFEPANGMAAIGCGADYAIGAMHVLLVNGTNRSIEDRMIQAMQIAGECANGIGPPFYIETL